MVERAQGVDAGLAVSVGDIKERALEVTATAREQLAGGGRFLREFIVKQPTRALGIALGMGVVLGWLIKRR